jgi:hypothetical protein
MIAAIIIAVVIVLGLVFVGYRQRRHAGSMDIAEAGRDSGGWYSSF